MCYEEKKLCMPRVQTRGHGISGKSEGVAALCGDFCALTMH